ncbi:MAG: hypothetical protein A2140_06615 [Candidatus Muproteobacteria bacterium RBG_16_62_13]|uniref:Uncharacterized protein n=1 Tax=Candidatus Muproteobacteria bacterium RBG_16_62_13 TaxID=1817756 RepID=A0A1F6T876_9PROT|nr:MAG: hypothetical protein A2140_06615 [Candidatus Muproteobacteria bacterium RBG_16_62_13]
MQLVIRSVGKITDWIIEHYIGFVWVNPVDIIAAATEHPVCACSTAQDVMRIPTAQCIVTVAANQDVLDELEPGVYGIVTCTAHDNR